MNRQRVHLVSPGDLVVVNKGQEFRLDSKRAFWWSCLIAAKTRTDYLRSASVLHGSDETAQSFLDWLIRTQQVFEV